MSDVGQRLVWSDKALNFNVPLTGCTVVEHIARVEQALEVGEIPQLYWVATVKDELRDVEKVRAGKSRIFEQPPFSVSYLIRKHFGAFLNMIKLHPGFQTHSAIGIDKDACWASFYYEMIALGEKGFDVDYSNYDGSVCEQMFMFFSTVCDLYYGQPSRVRDGLLEVIKNAFVVVGDIVMVTEQGNKSGNPMTDVFNSITNVFIIYTTYLNGRMEAGLSMDFYDFDEYVKFLTYGDDVIVVCSTQGSRLIDRCKVAKVAECFGLKVTSAAKTDELVPFNSIGDLTFLKSKFVMRDGVVMAPMPVEVCLRELQFIRKQNEGDYRIRDDIKRNAVRFMSHYGRKKSEELLGQLSSMGEVVDFNYELFVWDLFERQAAHDSS